MHTYRTVDEITPTLVISKRSDYLGAIHYEDADGDGTTSSLEISFIQHEEGRYRPNGSEMIYEYNLTDHLGNTRITFGDANTDGLAEILQENQYYPFGMAMTMSSILATAPPNNYLYQGKELQQGLEIYDFHARGYDASLGRTWQADPRTEMFYDYSPYSWVKNNPLLRVDPTGMTDFVFNKKTGEVAQVGKANDDSDRILKTDRRGEVKYKRNGEAKVAMREIEKGILEDGQNWKTDDQVIEVGENGQASVEGVKSFTLKLSTYLGKEIKGFSYSADGSGDVTDILLGSYENNTRTSSRAVTRKLDSKYGDTFSLDNVVQQFHTHPDGKLGATQSNPSMSHDVRTLQNDKPYVPNASFIILYKIRGQNMPEEYDYTHEYRPEKKP